MQHMKEQRDGYIAGLRALADRLEAHPDCPPPWAGVHPDYSPISVYATGAEEFVAAVRAIGGAKQRTDDGVEVVQVLGGGLYLRIRDLAGAVCERVQVGTRVEQVPDPEWVAPEPPMVEVEVPVYEVRCPDSILRVDETAAVAQ